MTDQLRLAIYRRAILGIDRLINDADETSKETGFDPDPWLLIDCIREELRKVALPSSYPLPVCGGDEVRNA